jgi:hypothetical protein
MGDNNRLQHLSLPLVIQESLLPRTSGVSIFHRKYGTTDITLSAGVSRGKRLLLPSGLISRRLLYWAITTARYNKSPEIVLDGSPTFLRNLNLGVNGKRRRDLKVQLKRLVHTSITIEEFGRYGESFTLDLVPLFDSMDFMDCFNTDAEQLRLFQTSIRFSDKFYNEIERLPHQPINQNALFSLESPLAMDIYLWAQRRTYKIKQDKLISWNLLYHQFKRPNETKSAFRRSFTKALSLVCSVMNTWDDRSFAMAHDEGVVIKSCPPQFERDIESGRPYPHESPEQRKRKNQYRY